MCIEDSVGFVHIYTIFTEEAKYLWPAPKPYEALGGGFKATGDDMSKEFVIR
jgi:hypothetical protein